MSMPLENCDRGKKESRPQAQISSWTLFRAPMYLFQPHWRNVFWWYICARSLPGFGSHEACSNQPVSKSPDTCRCITVRKRRWHCRIVLIFYTHGLACIWISKQPLRMNPVGYDNVMWDAHGLHINLKMKIVFMVSAISLFISLPKMGQQNEDPKKLRPS